MDALYQFVDRLPIWIVDDDIVEVWRTGDEDDPKGFKGWEAKKAEWGQALLLSWAPLRMSDGVASQTIKVVHSCHGLHPPLSGGHEHKRWHQRLVEPLCGHTEEKHECPLSTAQTLSGNILPKSFEPFISSPALPLYQG